MAIRGVATLYPYSISRNLTETTGQLTSVVFEWLSLSRDPRRLQASYSVSLKLWVAVGAWSMASNDSEVIVLSDDDDCGPSSSSLSHKKWVEINIDNLVRPLLLSPVRQIRDISLNELYLWFCGNWNTFQGIADGKVRVVSGTKVTR